MIEDGNEREDSVRKRQIKKEADNWINYKISRSRKEDSAEDEFGIKTYEKV